MKSKEDTPTPSPATEDESLKAATFQEPKTVSKYQISYLLGEGGMGRVYRARDPVLIRDLAVKILSGNIVNVSQIQRFQREAKAMGKLDHPGIVGAYDFGVDETHGPYLVMEYVEGKDLLTFIEENGPLSGSDFIETFNQILDALEHAHSNKIIHRDLKPGNILISNTDEGLKISILDFGIAKILEQADQLETKTGTMIGSPKYMSPEQIKGKKLDERSDIYSLGCVMFEVLTGAVPFQGKTVLETFELHQREPVPKIEIAVTQLDGEGLEKIIQQCLAKSPDQRFQNAKELKEALNTVIKHVEPEEDVVDRFQESKAPLSKGIILGIVAMSLVAVGAVFFVFNKNFAIKPKTEAEHKKTVQIQQARLALDDDGLKKLNEDKVLAKNDSPTVRHLQHYGHQFIEYRSVMGNDETFSRFLLEQKDLKNLMIAKAGLNMTGIALRNLPDSLERIVILGKNFDKDYMEQFPKLARLKSLYVRTVKRKDALKLFKVVPEKFPDLKRLVIDHSDMNDDDLLFLGKLVTLDDIGLTRCNELTGSGFRYLKKLPHLNLLHLNSSNSIESKNLKNFKGSSLKKLNLNGVGTINDDAVKILAGLKLESIIVGEGTFSKKAKQKLKKLSPGTIVVEFKNISTKPNSIIN